MFAALHLPGLELHCLLAADEITDEIPAALLSSGGEREKAHILALNPCATQHGLAPGMSNLQALARCADIRFLNRNPQTEAEVRKALLDFAESLTPDYEFSAENTILLDLSTCVLASPRDWSLGTLRKARCLRLPVHLAIAETPDLAHLLSLSPLTSSHLSSHLSSPPLAEIHYTADARHFSQIPIRELLRSRAFRISRTNKEALDLWGIKTIAELSDLPRQGLAERLGNQLAWLHDVIHGKEKRLLKLHQPEMVFRVSHDFEDAVSQFDPILFIARRLLQKLTTQLREIQHTASALHFQLFYENNFSYARTLALSEPSLNTEILLRSLHTHLDSIQTSAPICSFSIRLLPTLPTHKQHEIFQKGLKDPHRFADTMEQLVSLLGSDKIGLPFTTDTHSPDSFKIHHPTAVPETPESSPSSHLPMARFRPPIRIEVMSEKHHRFHHPLAILTDPHRGKITATRGPYPLSGNWWETLWQQVEWDVELSPNCLLRLAQSSEKTWHLAGIYGG